MLNRYPKAPRPRGEPRNSRVPAARLRIGVDTGGTFTDFVMIRGGSIYTHKTPSTPSDYSQGILRGLSELLTQVPITEDASFDLVHATTVATNALLERKGARTALITTRGFRDVLEIGRQQRPRLYDLHPSRPAPLVPRALRLEAAERVDARGEVCTRLTAADVRRLVATVRRQRVESVAVCLLFSFLHPAHERTLREALRKAGFEVSISSEVSPEFREYERTSTTVINAYVAPIMKGYLRRLAEPVRALGATSFRVVQSNGGSLSDRAAAERPVHTLLSGPAAGLTGALSVSREALASFGVKAAPVITFDMGGTSTDVALLQGEPGITTEARVAGLPVNVPMVDLHTVGAGGGSIARLDAGGALHVGPASAGAEPGPACYGRGTDPTVTDANLVAGRIIASRFLDGRMPLFPERAHAALDDLGRQMGVDAMAAAAAVLRIVNANMVRAIRSISVERGQDPREFTLVSFGGAGGLHACEVAEALHMRRVLIPRHPGVLSAWGAASSDVIQDYAVTLMRPCDDETASLVSRRLQEFCEQARRDLHQEGVPTARMELWPALDLRYAGQAYELTVPLRSTLVAAVLDFHEAHRKRYGHAFPAEPVQLVTLRLRAIGRTPQPRLAPLQQQGNAAPLGPRGLPALERDALPPGRRIKGPCLLTESYATTFLPSGWSGRADVLGHFLVER